MTRLPICATIESLRPHNPHHAYMVGDHLVLLNRGRKKLDCTYDEISLDDLTKEMAGGDELETLTHKLRR